MGPGVDTTAFFKEINLSRDFPDIDDVEGYVEQADYFDRTKKERKYFYRLGNTMSISFVPCADIDCEGAYFIRDLLSAAYTAHLHHMEGTLPCCVCREQERTGNWCEAKFSIDIKYKTKAQEPIEGTTVPSPDERYDLY